MPCISLKRILSIVAFLGALAIEAAPPPNVILVMTDDQGYGQTGYYDHPLLETPNLDKMAENGLRFDRFYAGSSVCSPTRASVLTGRTPHRSGVPDHGYALRHQEKTLPQALKNAGYTTGFFGKWHLNGLRGPGVPITEDDPYSPGTFGFEDWLAVTNFFDIDPVMSKNGDWTEYTGITSDIIVDAAMTFIVESTRANQPFFAVIWDGSPHDPFLATEEDRAPFIPHMNEKAANHLAEIVAFDRSLGRLREFLREQNLSENTILWYCSDNGGLKGTFGDTVKGLRGMKGTPFEGGLRVPAIVEWPGTIEPRITQFNASTMDIFPTLVDVIGLPESSMT
ncbi:MAG: sulfatase-like hydrolase/transferase, partial [Puniceicoccales bacterium]